MKPFFSLVFLAVFFVACKKGPAVEKNESRNLYNVAYGPDTAQRMDVYLPANRTTAATKVLVLIHGGAWTTGDKTELNPYIPEFRKRLPEYAFFNINYRLAALPSTHVFPTQENDVKAAIEFILSKAEDYQFNKEKFSILGASAGGHLALLQAYKNTTPKVKTLIDMFGPTDLAALYAASNPVVKTGMQSLLSGTPSSNPSMYQASSPIHFVSAQSPPTLILHGSADPLVPLAQSTALKNKLQTAGVPVQMITYPLEGHGWNGASLTDTYEKIAAFLSTYNP